MSLAATPTSTKYKTSGICEEIAFLRTIAARAVSNERLNRSGSMARMVAWTNSKNLGLSEATESQAPNTTDGEPRRGRGGMSTNDEDLPVILAALPPRFQMVRE